MKNILTIAGFDPSAGAGIMQDIDVFRSFGFHGIGVPTAVVAQGPLGVTGIYPAGLPELKENLRIAAELALSAIKIGVVCEERHIGLIADFLKQRSSIFVVLDPIAAAKNDQPLISNTGTKALMESMLPLTTLVTPNTVEAGLLCRQSIRTVTDMREAAKRILRLGPREVVIKGGHIEGNPVDVYYNGKQFLTYEKRRVDRIVHGTGCLFSSLLTCFRALGYDAADAFFAAEEKMEMLMNESYRIADYGYYYASSGILNGINANKWDVIQSLIQTKDKLIALNPVELVPEVQMNIGYAVIRPKDIHDIAAFSGRIEKNGGKVVLRGEPAFGASSHVSRMILTYMKAHPAVRACATVKYDKAFIGRAQAAGMAVVFYDGTRESVSRKKTEGKNIDFIIDYALKTRKRPDIVYDKGYSGKEPMIRIFGRNPEDVITKMEIIRS